jgi:hypothetical protein
MRTALTSLLLAFTLAAAAAEPADPLAHLRSGHPRLLFTDADLAIAKDAAGTDPLRAALHARIIEAAVSDLGMPPLKRVLKGPRLLDVSRTAIGRIATCAMAYRLTGDSRFADEARSNLLTVCAFPDWNPSHFLDVAEMSFAVAIGYDWLYPVLSEPDRAAVKAALLGKALAFAPAAYAEGGPRDRRLFFATAHMNWNQVCNGGLLAAALGLADEEPALARSVVEGVRRSLPLAMEAYQPDGAYPEGPGYWSYGTEYNAIILALLDGALGTDFGLGDAPAFDRTAFYRTVVEGPAGLCFNYADGESRLGDSPAYEWLARRFGDRAALEWSRVLLRKEIHDRSNDRFLALHAAWFPAETGGKEGAGGALGRLPLCTHFRGGADIALFRSAWNDPDALFLGFKAGNNATNHAHLDLGSFVLDADGVRWAVDLGPDDYDLPGYFGDRRWSYFRLNNRSHNTVTPGDGLQDTKATAAITEFSASGDRPFAVADLTAAYPRAARRILRGVIMIGRSRVLVQDEFTALRPGAPVRWAMVTGARIEISPDGRAALLSQASRSLEVRLLAPVPGRFRAESAAPPTPEEDPNSGYSVLALGIPANVEAVDLRICVALAPVGVRWQREAAPDPGPIETWR